MEKLRQRCVIFSDKNAHRQTPDSRFGRGKPILCATRGCVNELSRGDSAKGIPSRSLTKKSICAQRPITRFDIDTDWSIFRKSIRKTEEFHESLTNCRVFVCSVVCFCARRLC